MTRVGPIAALTARSSRVLRTDRPPLGNRARDAARTDPRAEPAPSARSDPPTPLRVGAGHDLAAQWPGGGRRTAGAVPGSGLDGLEGPARPPVGEPVDEAEDRID